MYKGLKNISSNSMNLLGICSAIGAGVFFGIIGPTTKLAYNLGSTVMLAIVLRYIFATIIALPTLIIIRPKIQIYQDNLKIFIFFTFGSILLTTGLLFAVNFIQVSLTMLIFCTYPIVILIFSIYINKEKIIFYRKILYFIAFLGIFFALGPSFKNLNLIGVIFALMASIGASTMIISNQKLSNNNISPIYIHIFTNFFNAIFFSLIAFLFFDINLQISTNTWIILSIPTTCYTVAFFLQLLAIEKIGQSKTALLLYIEPIVGIIGATILLNEKLNEYQTLGVVIVIASLVLGSYSSKKIKNDFS